MFILTSIPYKNFFMDCINLIFQPKKRGIISFGSSILTVIIMPILPKNLFRWSRRPPFSVDEIRMKGIISTLFFLWLAFSKKILACGNVIGISSPKFFFSMKARDGKCCSKFCLLPWDLEALLQPSLCPFFALSPYFFEAENALEVVARSKGYNT